MKDSECRAYMHTYHCDKNDCIGCQYRYEDINIIGKLHELAKQTDCPVYLGDKEVDSYVRLSDVLKIIKGEWDNW